MAKDLVRTRKYVQKFYGMRTQLQAVGLRIQVSSALVSNIFRIWLMGVKFALYFRQ